MGIGSRSCLASMAAVLLAASRVAGAQKPCRHEQRARGCDICGYQLDGAGTREGAEVSSCRATSSGKSGRSRGRKHGPRSDGNRGQRRRCTVARSGGRFGPMILLLIAGSSLVSLRGLHSELGR